MASNGAFEVRVSRKLLLLLTVVGLVFLLVGLDIGFFHKVVGPEFGQDKPIVKWLFLFFAVICGGVIAVNCFIYLIFPPLMLRVTKETITFAVGLRYNPFDVPTRLLESVTTYTQESNLEVNGKKAIVEGGAELILKNDSSIPSQKTTSMGVAYVNYTIRIQSTYANTSGQQIVEEVNKIIKS